METKVYAVVVRNENLCITSSWRKAYIALLKYIQGRSNCSIERVQMLDVFDRISFVDNDTGEIIECYIEEHTLDDRIHLS